MGKVTIGPCIVGHVAVTDVAAVPGLSPRIRFGLSWTLGHLRPSGEASLPGDEYHLIDFGGELRVGADDLFVGTLVRDGSRHPLRSLDHVQTQEGFVALDLDSHGPEYSADLDLVFANGRGDPLDYRVVVQRHFKPIVKAAGLEPLRPYDLRHTCATLLLAGGEYPKVVAERLGHSSTVMTMDVYSHVLPDMQEAAADKLEGLLFGA